jgi:hypothetical protein
MSEWSFRFAEKHDAQPFADWALNNHDIPHKDIQAGTREQNPTVQYFVIENDGKVVLCVPAFCVLRIAYLLFNPDTSERERIKAMGMMREALKAFAENFGINSIETLSKEGYAVAQWAKKHEFKVEDRQLFGLTVGLENKNNVQFRG